jgi:hypothetical protein
MGVDDLNAMVSQEARESPSCFEHHAAVQAVDRHVGDRHADRLVPPQQRPIHAQRNDLNIESGSIETLGRSYRVQLGAANPHIVENIDKPDSFRGVTRVAQVLQGCNPLIAGNFLGNGNSMESHNIWCRSEGRNRRFFRFCATRSGVAHQSFLLVLIRSRWS